MLGLRALSRRDACARAGHLSDPPGAPRGRLRRRRSDRHPGALHRRQARHAARPAHHRREQDRRRRHARDPRRAGAAGRRLQPAALHAFRIDQHRALQESGLQARRPRADLADRAILLRPRASPTRCPPRASSSSCNMPRRVPARSATRTLGAGLGAGDPGAADREARRHLDEPHPVPHRLAGHAGPDRRPGRTSTSRRPSAWCRSIRQAAQDPRRHQPGAAQGPCPTSRR